MLDDPVAAGFEIVHERPHSFYPEFFRKGDLKDQTHYCPGCGHGIAHKLVAEAIDELGLQDRTILISPVGCSVFAYYYLDTGNVQAAHGRAPAVATGVKRAHPESIVVSYQGDGDLAAIGMAEILHAANRGENITVFFINNAIYGMTGGQMAPTTLLGQKSTTTPYGRDHYNDGYPVKVCELLATLEAPVYLERVALGNAKQINAALRAIRKALRYQTERAGFSLVEILSPCPTIWKLDPVAAQKRVREVLVPAFPLGVYRDRGAEIPKGETLPPRPLPAPPPPLDAIPGLLDIDEQTPDPPAARPAQADLRIRVAGFGGQGVLMLGEVLAEAGLQLGLEVSWLPSYGPEMRSGTSNCHVRISSQEVDSPLVARPNVLLALNEPSLRKFLPTVEVGGWVLYNHHQLPADIAVPEGIHLLPLACSELADSLGETRAGNIVMLGALLAATDGLPIEAIHRALALCVKSARWLEIDRRALATGQQAAREALSNRSQEVRREIQ
ncbi:MAG: 2-oxoacid:acceptor oxidoreductase family protein [Bryobacterales bacterium]|nr:2-oxoacid:acceptor oxidoreductase family protein [Bryobacterales bacterium]